MPELPHLSGKEVIRILERLGFTQVRQRGSHVVMKKSTPTEDIGCVVPLHKEVAIGTLRSILRQGRITIEELLEKLK